MGCLACRALELVALSDPRVEVMDRAGERHGVAPARRYRDYREMLERERPDIVSVATQPEQRAAIVIWACEHGARATYAEEPMAASMEQADAMVAAVVRQANWHMTEGGSPLKRRNNRSTFLSRAVRLAPARGRRSVGSGACGRTIERRK